MTYELEKAQDEYYRMEKDYARALDERDRADRRRGLTDEEIQRELAIKALLKHEAKQKLQENARLFVESQNRRIEEKGLAKVQGNMVKVGGEEVPVFDLNCMIADSLQRIYASEDPKAEYFDWVSTQRTIEADYRTNGVSDEELVSGRGFAAFLDERETEMKLVMSLYMSAAIHGKGYYKEKAQEQLFFMRFKLRELRRIRTSIEETNKQAALQNQAEKAEEERKERKRAEVRAYMMLKAGVDAYEFEQGFAEKIVSIRPDTKNLAAANARVAFFRQRKINNRDLISKGYRMGKSRDDLEQEIEEEAVVHENPGAENLHRRINDIQGFRQERYQRVYERDYQRA